jgi:hypothetical protein
VDGPFRRDREGHKVAERDQQAKSALLLQHFFEDVEPMLEPPSVNCEVTGTKLQVAVKFKPGSRAETGRIWWMYDRAPDGSAAYIRDLFPDDQWEDVEYHPAENAWTTEIDVRTDASHIDFFSNRRKTIAYRAVRHPTYISSPYTRVEPRGAGDE